MKRGKRAFEGGAMRKKCPLTGEKAICFICQECEDKRNCEIKVVVHAAQSPRKRHEKQLYTDHKGNEYTSFSRLCNAYGLSYNKAYSLVKYKSYTYYDAFIELLERSGHEDTKE